MNEELRQWFTDAANVATSLGIPAAAIALYLYFNNQAKERDEEKAQRLAKQQEIDGDLKENYYDILKILIHKPYLDVHDQPLQNDAHARQQGRIYEYICSLFETAHMRLADQEDYLEMWQSWEDYINEWVVLRNFRAALPKLLVGENPDFVKYMQDKLTHMDISEAPADIPRPK